MNDTDLLNGLLVELKWNAEREQPMGCARINRMIGNVEQSRAIGDRRKQPLDAIVVEDAALPAWPRKGIPVGVSHPKEINTKGAPIRQMDKNQYLESPVEWTLPAVEPPFQNYWRCNHYPIAIENFFSGRARCVCTVSFDIDYVGIGSWQ